MEGPISFWGYKEQESNLILPEHDDDVDDDDDDMVLKLCNPVLTLASSWLQIFLVWRLG
jgi:hypothetical protein